MKHKQKVIFMAVTTDKYELPIAEFNNIEELCAFNGRNITHNYTAIHKKSIDKKNNCRYVTVHFDKVETLEN